MSREALIITAPLLGYLAGPPLGPAMLAGAAHSVGGTVRHVDLNAAWLRALSTTTPRPQRHGPTGDHARPSGGFTLARRSWTALIRGVLHHDASSAALGTDPVSALCAEHDAVLAAAQALAARMLPIWRPLLEGPRPHLIGLSILWSGQVIGALAAGIIARQLWPGVPIVAGGAHITALVHEIAGDHRYGALIDGFVAGYAEGTFKEMLLADTPLSVPGVIHAGSREVCYAQEDPGLPVFGDLSGYSAPRLILPAQTARGCAYRRCVFCTYPHIEGDHRPLPFDALDAVVERAALLGADVAIKDALAPARRLDEIGERIAGRVRWAACTRLVPRLGRARLTRLVRQGLATLEIGVESLDPSQLVALEKHQPLRLLEDLLADAAGLDLHLVLNFMVGFPGQSREDAEAQLWALEVTLPARYPRTQFTIERNRLQVERRSPLAMNPEAHGITLGRSWPWSSLLGWNAPVWQLSSPHAGGLHAAK